MGYSLLPPTTGNSSIVVVDRVPFDRGYYEYCCSHGGRQFDITTTINTNNSG